MKFVMDKYISKNERKIIFKNKKFEITDDGEELK